MAGIPRIVLAFICAVFALLAAGMVSAQPRAAELRFQLFSPSYRWSAPITGSADYNAFGTRSLYMSPGLGGRYFPKSGSHGIFAQIEYRFDLRVDEPWCLFDLDPCPYFDVDYAVAHVGYAYRHIVQPAKSRGRRFWAFTPHVSVAAGWAKNSPAEFGIPARSPVVGTRVGFDIDLHFMRWFLGWSLRYEALAQTRGPIGWSHFFGWNAIPAFHMGVDLGRPQNPPDGYPRN